MHMMCISNIRYFNCAIILVMIYYLYIRGINLIIYGNLYFKYKLYNIDIFEIFIPEFNLIIKHCKLKLNNKKIFIPWHKGIIHNQL